MFFYCFLSFFHRDHFAGVAPMGLFVWCPRDFVPVAPMGLSTVSCTLRISHIIHRQLNDANHYLNNIEVIKIPIKS
jgi:hypothetical protein